MKTDPPPTDPPAGWTASTRASGGTEAPAIAIVGGGICGLTTALALERRGRSPTVYEAADAYGPVGAGILLQTNAMLVLDRLGVAERVREAGVALDGGGLRAPGGEFMTRFDLDDLERREFGYGFVAVHRADLLDILRSALETEVRTGKDCVDVVGTDPPTVHFDDGSTATPDLLVGADGIDSTVRDAVAPEVTPRPLDAVAYRALVDLDIPDPYRTRGFEVWDYGTYTGGSPVDEDRFYWFATAPEPLTDGAASPEATEAALRDRLGDAPEPLPAVLDGLDPADLVVTDLRDLPALDSWSRDRVVLAGDAAHAMLPFAGQGAAQAIEDGLALADALAGHTDHGRAFAAYEGERRPRADRVRSESRRLGRLGTIQSRLGCRLRNGLLDAVPDGLVRRFRRRRAANTSLPTPS
ncbi:FAD-dependent monooxygenase [Haloglomus litoreum]|uniref:FAD-dependent monooxygenase n=1 Tax=Haloglomus litoreum TaxID=3034026 RepID=UPI0023E8A846|nr:FAD-dependent monooxygenase [Haloglomus sp. DT116]